MRTYCTIAHIDELDSVQLLINSIKRIDSKAHFSILLIGKKPKKKSIFHFQNCSYYFYDKTYFSGRSLAFFKKYRYKDSFRESMIPEFLIMLLRIGIEKVIYLDRKSYCYQSLESIWESLKSNDVVLNPNGWSSSPLNKESFINNLKEGYYNSSFLGVSIGSISSLEWWSDMTLVKKKKKNKNDLCHFQSYLNLFPLLYENVHVLKDETFGISDANFKLRANKINVSDTKIVHYSEALIKQVELFADSGWKCLLTNYHKEKSELELPVFS